MFCTQCGAQQEDTARFCTVCGASMQQSEPTPVVVEQPAPAPVAGQPAQPVYTQPAQPVQPVQPAQPYAGQPVYGQPMVQQKVPGKGLAIAGMVLGIISLVSFWCYGFILGILAIILLIIKEGEIFR